MVIGGAWRGGNYHRSFCFKLLRSWISLIETHTFLGLFLKMTQAICYVNFPLSQTQILEIYYFARSRNKTCELTKPCSRCGFIVVIYVLLLCDDILKSNIPPSLCSCILGCKFICMLFPQPCTVQGFAVIVVFKSS